jgi:hypothetical protein
VSPEKLLARFLGNCHVSGGQERRDCAMFFREHPSPLLIEMLNCPG